jgi:anti-anti-sigma factor
MRIEAAQPSPVFEVRFEQTDGLAQIDVSGEFDVAAVEPFEKALWQLDGDVRGLLVDLRAVTFIDSSALSSLVVAHNETQAKGIELSILKPEDREVLRILRLTDIEGLLPLEDLAV